MTLVHAQPSMISRQARLNESTVSCTIFGDLGRIMRNTNMRHEASIYYETASLMLMHIDNHLPQTLSTSRSRSPGGYHTLAACNLRSSKLRRGLISFSRMTYSPGFGDRV